VWGVVIRARGAWGFITWVHALAFGGFSGAAVAKAVPAFVGLEAGHGALLQRLPGAEQCLGDGEGLYVRAEVEALRPSLEQLRLPLLPGLPEVFLGLARARAP